MITGVGSGSRVRSRTFRAPMLRFCRRFILFICQFICKLAANEDVWGSMVDMNLYMPGVPVYKASCAALLLRVIALYAVVLHRRRKHLTHNKSSIASLSRSDAVVTTSKRLR